MGNLYFPAKTRFFEKLDSFVRLFWWNGYSPHAAAMDEAVNVMLLEKCRYPVTHVLGVGVPALLRCETGDYLVFNLGRHSYPFIRGMTKAPT